MTVHCKDNILCYNSHMKYRVTDRQELIAGLIEEVMRVSEQNARVLGLLMRFRSLDQTPEPVIEAVQDNVIRVRFRKSKQKAQAK